MIKPVVQVYYSATTGLQRFVLIYNATAEAFSFWEIGIFVFYLERRQVAQTSTARL